MAVGWTPVTGDTGKGVDQLLGTVCRAGDLLDLFDARSPEWGATGVSKRLSITKSQAHEMLVSLEAIGLLRRGARGRFRLGWRMVTLSQRLVRSEFTASEARIVRELARHLRTSVDIFTCDGDRLVRVGGHGPSRPREASLGEDPMSAPAMVFLSHLEPERLASIRPDLNLDEELELALVRDRGLAVSSQHGRREAAAPVNDSNGALLAALAVQVPDDDWDTRGPILTRALVGTARRLSESLRGCQEIAAAPVRSETLVEQRFLDGRVSGGGAHRRSSLPNQRRAAPHR